MEATSGGSIWGARRRLVFRGTSKLPLAAVIIALCTYTAIRSPVFLTWTNWSNVLQQITIVGILACGTTLLMISGGIDLSIGANLSLSTVVIAWLMTHDAGIPVSIAAGIALATGVGLVNGTLASFSTAHPFIITLGMLTLLEGVALMISSAPIADLPPSFLDFAFERPLGLPMVVWFLIAIAVFSQGLLSLTVFGRRTYALGGSEAASQLAGIRIRVMKIVLYGLMGMMVGIAAVLLTSTLSAGQAYAGKGTELSAIAAVAIGGTPLQGGRGDIVGTLMGVLLIGLTGNALNLLSINPNLQSVLVGAIIVVAVMSQRGWRS